MLKSPLSIKCPFDVSKVCGKGPGEIDGTRGGEERRSGFRSHFESLSFQYAEGRIYTGGPAISSLYSPLYLFGVHSVPFLTILCVLRQPCCGPQSINLRTRIAGAQKRGLG